LNSVISDSRLRIVKSRISQCAELTDLAANASAIYHLAATVGVDLVVQSALHVLETSFHETEILFKAAAANQTPVLLTSTSEVYGKSEKSEFSEDDDLLIGPPVCARWSYACSKLMDEFLALAYAREKNLPVVIARLFNTVGPRQTGRYGMVLPRFIAAAKRGEPLRVFGDGAQTRCFCYVEDAVEALVRLQNCPTARGEVFNVGSTEEISIADLARLVIWVLKSSSSLEFVPYSDAYAPGFDDMRRRKPGVSKLKQIINYAPALSLQEIIERTAS
jgi:UDP-glucose 4-epimerase